jgi:hypothetical protein
MFIELSIIKYSLDFVVFLFILCFQNSCKSDCNANNEDDCIALDQDTRPWFGTKLGCKWRLSSLGWRCGRRPRP